MAAFSNVNFCVVPSDLVPAPVKVGFPIGSSTYFVALKFKQDCNDSRMRTARLLPLSPSIQCAGGRGVCSGEMPGPREGCLVLGREVPASVPGGCIPACNWGRPPCEQNHRHV